MNLNKIELTKKNLLKYVSDLDIFSAYIPGELPLNKNILSPLRSEGNPSFRLFIGSSKELCFNDFVLCEKGDAIKFVQLLYNLNFPQALERIAIDFNLYNHFTLPLKKEGVTLKKSNYDRHSIVTKLQEHLIIKIKSREWHQHDYFFWSSFGISLKTLEFFNVKPIVYYFINKHTVVAEKYAYAFRETKDYEITYKIYQPFSQRFKWFNSHDESVIQGWSQLPDSGDLLIITKSLKDVMSIYENLGIPAISLQSENVKIKKSIIKNLKKRFKKILILYDNDYDKEVNWGLKFAEELSVNIQVPYIYIPEEFKTKDFSDLISKYGIIQAVNIILKILKK